MPDLKAGVTKGRVSTVSLKLTSFGGPFGKPHTITNTKLEGHPKIWSFVEPPSSEMLARI